MVPLPLRDENPTLRPPVVTIALIVVNCLFWLFQLSHGLSASVYDYGAIPAWILRGISEGPIQIHGPSGWVRAYLRQEVPQPLSILTSMFMHGSWMHIIGNLWFLWIFGDNVEDSMGRLRFLIFYLLCGVLAALAQIVAMPGSTIPMVGASGAIAGVLGAYIVLHPHARVHCLWILFVFITTIEVPAWVLLGLWFLSQFFVPMGSGVAWMAHVGGFVAGFVLIRAFSRPPAPMPRPRRVPLKWRAWS